ncbi:MAG: hypothetical protein A2V79_07770 [Betaproteobacteria bacterium RBG_16_56_24]|nr:MAG: hypothetical protein A2V79_07770 [Betaproteobacteria bacterium RBG_16_56_24]
MKAAAAPAAKKTAVKKTAGAVAKSKKAQLPAVKKAAIPASGKKAPTIMAAVIPAKPAGNQKAMAKPTPEVRYRMVETAAYFIAERNGFQGRSDEHWAAAELEVAARLGERS